MEGRREGRGMYGGGELSKEGEKDKGSEETGSKDAVVEGERRGKGKTGRGVIKREV